MLSALLREARGQYLEKLDAEDARKSYVNSQKSKNHCFTHPAMRSSSHADSI